MQKIASLVLTGIGEWEKNSISKPKNYVVKVERMGFLRLTLQVEVSSLLWWNFCNFVTLSRALILGTRFLLCLGWPQMAIASSEQNITSPLRRCPFTLLFRFFELMEN